MSTALVGHCQALQLIQSIASMAKALLLQISTTGLTRHGSTPRPPMGILFPRRRDPDSSASRLKVSTHV